MFYIRDCFYLVIFIINIFHIHSLIVPDELPTILSIIYSNIPTIKKGTDSRIGWGFRLGNRADFQVLVELGPQIYTQPLANQDPDKNKNNKRNSIDNLSNELYAKRQLEKKINLLENKKKEKITENNVKIKETVTEDVINDGAIWLKTWSDNIQKNRKLLKRPKPGLALGEIDAKSVIPPDNENDDKN